MLVTFVSDDRLLAAAPDGRRLANTFTVDYDNHNYFAFKRDSFSHQAGMRIDGAVSMENGNYYLTWDLNLLLPYPQEMGAEFAFEVNVCINDGTPSTPWNCVYIITPSEAANSNGRTVTTYQKHVAQGGLPSTVAQTAISSIDSPACTVS